MRTRSAEEIDTVRDFKTLLKRGERGRYFCNQCLLCGRELDLPVCICGGKRCGRNLTDRIDSLRNDGEMRSFKCPACGRVKVVNAAVEAFRMVKKAQENGP